MNRHHLLANLLGLQGLFMSMVLGGMGSGCATTGLWDERGFHNPGAGWSLPYLDKTNALLGKDWTVMNWAPSADGKQWEHKGADKYWAESHIDWNNDGETSMYEKVKVPIFDLLFDHRSNNGSLWIQTEVIPKHNEDRDMQTALRNYADSLVGTSLHTQYNLFGINDTKARTFTTNVVNQEPISLSGGISGIVGVIEIADRDQMQLDPKARIGRIKVVMAKYHHFSSVGDEYPFPGILGQGSVNEARWIKVERNGKPHYQKTFLVTLGYFNDLTDFEKGIPDLDSLLKRLTFQDTENIPGQSPQPAKVVTPPEKVVTPPENVEAPPGKNEVPSPATTEPASIGR